VLHSAFSTVWLMGRKVQSKGQGTLLVHATLALSVAGGIAIGVVGASGPSGGSTFAPKSTTTLSPSSQFSHYTCHGSQRTLLNNSNAEMVENGGRPRYFTTSGKAYCVTYIQTYHWNNGKGAIPGSLSLRRIHGPAGLPSVVGPFNAKTSSGQNNAPNVNWYVDVPTSPPVIIDGIYTCNDSQPSTWSSNKATNGAGFCIIYGDPAIPPPPVKKH